MDRQDGDLQKNKEKKKDLFYNFTGLLWHAYAPVWQNNQELTLLIFHNLN